MNWSYCENGWRPENLRLFMGRLAWAKRFCFSRSCPTSAMFSTVPLLRVHRRCVAAWLSCLLPGKMQRYCVYAKDGRCPRGKVLRVTKGDCDVCIASGKLPGRPRSFKPSLPGLGDTDRGVHAFLLHAGRSSRSVRAHGGCRFCLAIASRSKRRLAVKNFDSETAKAFALEVCEQQQLSGENLSSVLDSMVKSSEGNPGAILRMIVMAKQSKYRNDDHIKWSPLYIDFLMAWARENSL